MSDNTTKLPRLIGKILVSIAIVLYVSYLIYLPFPDLFKAAPIDSLGVVFYGLATAGCAFVAWGLILGHADADGVKMMHVLRASAVGFALMSLMRLATAIFPPEILASMLPVFIGEFIAFGAVAFILQKKAKA